MKAKIFVPDIECDSCVKVLTKRLNNVQGVESFAIHDDAVDVVYDESLVRPQNLVETIKTAGYRASLHPFERKSFKERLRDFKENRQKYELERRGISYALWTFLALLLLEALAYRSFWSEMPSFLPKYGWWLLYLDIAVIAIGTALWHVRSYKAKVTSMVGMMIGMTFGMQAGLMFGTLLGATNGFFIGAMVGTVSGVLIGALTGRCCGIMGVMEGMMAGLMGGTMGPMISLMMFFDHLLWFMPVFMFVNVVIMGGLSYLLYEEVVEQRKDVTLKNIDFITYASLCILITGAFIILMIYGPTSSFIRAGGT